MSRIRDAKLDRNKDYSFNRERERVGHCGQSYVDRNVTCYAPSMAAVKISVDIL